MPHFPLFSSLVASMCHLWASPDGWETAQTGGHYSWPGCDTDNLVSIISQTLSRPQLSSSPGMAITTRDTNWVPNIFQWLPMETIGSMIKVLRHRNCPSLHCGESFKRPRLSLQATVMFQVSGCSWAEAQCTPGISRGWLCCKYVVHTALGDLKPGSCWQINFQQCTEDDPWYHVKDIHSIHQKIQYHRRMSQRQIWVNPVFLIKYLWQKVETTPKLKLSEQNFVWQSIFWYCQLSAACYWDLEALLYVDCSKNPFIWSREEPKSAVHCLLTTKLNFEHKKCLFNLNLHGSRL